MLLPKDTQHWLLELSAGSSRAVYERCESLKSFLRRWMRNSALNEARRQPCPPAVTVISVSSGGHCVSSGTTGPPTNHLHPGHGTCGTRTFQAQEVDRSTLLRKQLLMIRPIRNLGQHPRRPALLRGPASSPRILSSPLRSYPARPHHTTERIGNAFLASAEGRPSRGDRLLRGGRAADRRGRYSNECRP